MVDHIEYFSDLGINAVMPLTFEKCHADGLRYDQVTAIAESGGWFFAQDLTGTLRLVKPGVVRIAEY